MMLGDITATFLEFLTISPDKRLHFTAAARAQYFRPADNTTTGVEDVFWWIKGGVSDVTLMIFV